MSMRDISEDAPAVWSNSSGSGSDSKSADGAGDASSADSERTIARMTRKQHSDRSDGGGVR